MKTPTLKKLIEKLKLNYFHPAITDENFPYQKIPKGEAKLLQFNKTISTEDVLKELKEQGYRPATLHEGLAWAEKEWNKKDAVVFLGSSWRDPSGDVGVPYLSRWRGDERGLYLNWRDYDWDARCRFLVFSESQPLGHLVSEPKGELPGLLVINGVKYKRIND